MITCHRWICISRCDYSITRKWNIEAYSINNWGNWFMFSLELNTLGVYSCINTGSQNTNSCMHEGRSHTQSIKFSAIWINHSVRLPGMVRSWGLIRVQKGNVCKGVNSSMYVYSADPSAVVYRARAEFSLNVTGLLWFPMCCFLQSLILWQNSKEFKLRWEKKESSISWSIITRLAHWMSLISR